MSGFGAWDPCSTTGVIRSGGSRLGTGSLGGLGGWPSGLDSPNTNVSGNFFFFLNFEF